MQNFTVARGRRGARANRMAATPCPRTRRPRISAITNSAAESCRYTANLRKANSANPRGPRPKNLPGLLVEALNERVVVTIDGERRVGGVLTRGGADVIIIDDPLL